MFNYAVKKHTTVTNWILAETPVLPSYVSPLIYTATALTQSTTYGMYGH